MDAAKEMWEQRLGVELIDFVLEADGLRVVLGWDAGVELISPHGRPGPAGTMVRAHLDKQGEGVYAAVLLTDDFESVETGMKAVGSRLAHPEEAVIEGVPLPNGVVTDDNRLSRRCARIRVDRRALRRSSRDAPGIPAVPANRAMT